MEMAENERQEIGFLEAYLPQALPADEIAAIVRDAIAESGATSRRQMGEVMKLVNSKIAGRAEGRTVSAEVQRQLGS
jgi:uncharacterized protein YqeY